MSTYSPYVATAVRQLLDLHGEDTTYTPKGGSARSIKALFRRLPLEPLDAAANTRGVPLDVQIADDEALGTDELGTDSITFGGDSLAVPAKFGGGGKTYDIIDFISRDGGWWHVRLYIKS